MICLLDTEDLPDVSFIARIGRARRGYKGIIARDLAILGVRVLYITIDKTPSISQETVKKRIKYAAERMHTARIGKVLFSKNFPYREIVLREGFDEIDEGSLMETLAGKIAAEFAGADKVAAFFADRMTASAEQTFCALCRDFRYVMAVVESEAGRLFASLGRRLGISVIGQPTGKQLLKADVAVFFNAPHVTTVLPEKCIVIPVGDIALERIVARKAVSGISVGLINGKKPDIPNGFSHGPLFAVAIDAGTLHHEAVFLHDIRITDIAM